MASPFVCFSCGKKYKRQIYYENHVASCRLNNFAKLNREDNCDSDSTTRELLTIVKELTKKYEQVSNELAVLRKYVEKTKRQINIPDWLDNKYMCETNFKDWIKRLEIDYEYLQIVFDNDLITGITKIIQDYFVISDDNIPVRCFEQKRNVFYVFQDRWKTMTSKEFEFMVNCINSKIIHLLKKWQDENRRLIELNDDSYQRNVMNVLGGNLSNETINSKIKTAVFNHLKFNLRQIVEYEFI